MCGVWTSRRLRRLAGFFYELCKGVTARGGHTFTQLMDEGANASGLFAELACASAHLHTTYK